MENSFQTSFIPKKPITSGVSIKEPRSIFSLLATFILVVFVILSVGVFVYRAYLIKQKESFSNSLSVVRDSFEKETIDELDLYNKHTDAAQKILSGHMVFSPLFALLEDITIPSVQYKDFIQEINDGVITVKIEGLARDYRSIAIQSDMFNTMKGRSFTNVIFSNLTKDKNDNISFNLQFNVDSNLLSYEKNTEKTTENTELQNLNNPTQ